MTVFDKASWHIDAGETGSDVIGRFIIIFSFLHEQQLLNDDGEELLQLGIDSSISLHSDLLKQNGIAFLEIIYNKAMSKQRSDLHEYLAGAYDTFLQLQNDD